ncbi:MAG: InlB B-repeat-containing protein, partial [Peptococcaceae bacterium]|nr:InlB B-repeat-containing protein [Peptococcaceae bacterium]
VWTAKSVNVVFHTNDGSEDDVYDEVENTFGDPLNPITDPSRDGYTFKRWVDKNGKPYVPGETLVDEEELELYAEWEAIGIILNFNKNHSDADKFTEADPTSLSVTYDQTVGSLPTAPTRYGYDFTGWSTDSGSGNTVNFDGSYVVTFTEAKTVYAVWSKKDLYTVTYDDNDSSDGNVLTDINSYEPHDLVTVLGPGTLTKTNHTFRGWSTTPNGSTKYEPGDTFPIDDNITLYAVWDENAKYTVTYDGNGETGGTAPTDHTRHYVNTEVEIMDQGDLVKKHRTFIGWAEDPDTDTATHTPGHAFLISENTTLYAVWTEDESYVVTYNPGIHGTFPAQITGNLYSGDPTPKAPKAIGQPGWTFTGWSPKPAATVTGDTVYTAQWVQSTIMYTVKFIDWNGSLLKAQQVAQGSSATPPADPSHDGFTFTGWDRSYTNVQSDTTITALYIRIIEPPVNPSDPPDDPSPSTPSSPNPPVRKPPTTPPTTVSEPEPTDSTPTPTPEPLNPSHSANNTNNTKPVASTPNKSTKVLRQETLDQIKETTVPIAKIGGTEIPLTGLPGMAVWALVNLILCVLGIFVGVFAIYRARQRKNEYQNPKDMERYQEIGEQREEQHKRKQRRNILLITAIGMSILGVIVFMITENMMNLMVLVDYWTIVNAIIFAVEIIATVFIIKHKKDDDERDEKMQERMRERENRFTEIFGR